MGDQKFPIALYQVKDRDRVRRGQDFWHADNSYNPHGGGPTLLYGLKIPKGADGRTLGDTQFADAASAAASLPQERDQQSIRKASSRDPPTCGHPGGREECQLERAA